MERWRVAVAIISALAALPLLAINNVSSADSSRTSATALDDPAVDLLASRATAWTDAHESERLENVDEALTVAQQIKAAESERLIAQARLAHDEVEAQRLADEAAAERRAAAERKAAADKRAAADTKAAESKAATSRKASLPTPVTAPEPRSGDPTAEQWAALRSCEASGRYNAVSSGGRFRGAYQFDQATWDHVAQSNYPQLVGIDPAAASPGDQDAVALALYRARGTSPWPRCGAAFG